MSLAPIRIMSREETEMIFEMNGKAYRTDRRTLGVLRSIIPGAKESKDFSAVAVVMILGLESGQIKEIEI